MLYSNHQLVVFLEWDAQELSIRQNVFSVQNVSHFLTKSSTKKKTFTFPNCTVMHTVNHRILIWDYIDSAIKLAHISDSR